MATLPIEDCPAGVWTDISTNLVNDSTYIVSGLGRASYVLSESATEPDNTDSRFEYKGNEKQTIKFVNVPFWVKPIGSNSVDVQIQESL